MLGPNALTEELLQTYLRYLFSAHPIGIHNPELEASLRARLREERPLVNGPILELDPASKSGESVAELIAQGILCEATGRLQVGGADLSERRLYTHQSEAIRACKTAKSVVVASGTGSGKTEAWLYPIVDSVLAAPGQGLRAIVIYPMNALADDQRRIRMRGLLSGTEVSYGEYTGNTPYDETDTRAKIDYNAPPNEYQTRKKLRETPPNILITNPSMLEYLLLRPEDSGLFRNASLQFLILDEAHTYRGAYGIELGHLIRRLKARLGVRSVQSFVLSATIDRDREAIASFANNLTGEIVSTDSIFFGEYAPAQLKSEVVHHDPATYACFTPEVIASVLSSPANLGKVPGIDEFGDAQVLLALESEAGSRALWELLHNDGHVIALRDELQLGPKPIAELAEKVFGPQGPEIDQVIARLVDAAASARETKDSVALLPARYHVFLRGLDGVRVCFNPEHGSIGTGPHAVGAYSLESRDTCECGYPLWELLVCGDCAAWYIRDRRDGGSSPDAETSGPAGALQIYAPDESIEEDDSPTTRCLLCRSSSGCSCPASLRRSVVDAGSRKTCLNCGSDSVMGVMTGTMAPTQILAEVLTSAQDGDPKYSGRGSGKKLLTFSDSRRAAAGFAAQLDRSHRQHIQRAAIYQALRAGGVMGLDEMAARVSKILVKHGFYDIGPNNLFRAKALVFAEFTASYASRRRLEALGLGTSQLVFAEEPDSSLVHLVGSTADATALVQSLLEIMQYDSAVTRPELMAPLKGFAGSRPDVYFSMQNGSKRWISPSAPLHQRLRSRQFNLVSRIFDVGHADTVLSAVWNYAVTDGALVGDGDRYQVSSDRIEFLMPPSWYRCASCRRVTPWALSSGKGCPTRNCEGLLHAVDDPIRWDDHFTRNVVDPIEYFRIEEHTAQLDTHEARKIGAQFRDGLVNILSCSTTFELGVDIGTLQSVFMRNVPPSVANYRQRAGRAGRTRQGAAFLVTYCGPTPHDRVFFENANDIITGEIAVPVFNLENPLLTKRHINSLLLAALWRSVANRLGKRGTVEDFLLAEDAHEMMMTWLVADEPILDEELGRYAEALGVSWDAMALRRGFCADLNREREAVRARLDTLMVLLPALAGAAMQNATNEIRRLRERRIIEHFSARTLLPSYAFPIYVVELLTSDARVSLQRDLRIAINEYAPGSQVVAAKKTFESVAVVLKGPTAGAKTPFWDVWLCDACQAAYNADPGECDCGTEKRLKPGKYIIPDGFITDMTKDPAETIARTSVRPNWSTQHILSSGQLGGHIQNGPIRASKYESTRFLFLNHGDPGEQFRICSTRGSRVKGPAQGGHKNPYGRKCAGQIHRWMIGHELIGEALALQIDDTDGLLVPDDHVFYSTLSFALVEGISKAMAIERRDLGVNVRRVNREGGTRWEVMIVDNVPGGAGYVAQIMRGDGLQRSFREAAKIASCGNCPEESTCYACLRTMGNQALHDKMQRGPVLRFLEAICDRLVGEAGVFGVNIDAWLQKADIEEVVLGVPTLTDTVAHRILELGARCDVTVFINAGQSVAAAAWIDAWRAVWSKKVRIKEGPVPEALIATRAASNWRLIRGVTEADLADGLIQQGRMIEGDAAEAYLTALRKASTLLSKGRALPAYLIPLERGQRTSEKELFGYLFEGIVDSMTIEDPYLFEAIHERRLCAWLDLPQTQSRVVVETVRPDAVDKRRLQESMLGRLKAKYGEKHDVVFRFRQKRDMHDRNVTIRGAQSARISLPKGLDFIDEKGVVNVATSVTIVTSPST